MASNNESVKKFGQIGSGSHTTVSRSISKTDNTTLDIEIIGDYSVLEDNVIHKAPGDSPSVLVDNAMNDQFLNYKIKNLSVTRESGNIGVLKASLVYATSNSQPFHVTYTVDMVEVQKPLISHPKIQDAGEKTRNEIALWKGTNEGLRFEAGEDVKSDKFWYVPTDASITDPDFRREVTTDMGRKYCAAVTAGIETYNVYLPVVTKVSLYLKEPPGCNSDENTHKLSGQMDFSSNIGKWDDSFDFTLKNYPHNEKQGWFKSKDAMTQNSDGTWQRTEEWTFTNDRTHAWIYEET